MPIQLPDLSAMIKGDMTPLRIVFAQVKAESKEASNAVKEAGKAGAAAAKMEIDAAFSGPAIKPRFTAFEQEVRDGMARAIRQMREQAQQTNISNEVKLRLYGPQQAAKDVEQIEEVAVVAKREAAQASQGFLQELNGQLGRGSTAGLLARVLRGGGPVLAVGLITNALKSATDEAAKLAQQFKNGEIDSQQLRIGLAEQLPILGNILSAGQSIREMITGEKAALAAANAEAERMQALSSRIAGYFKDSAAAVGEFRAQLAKINLERAGIGASPLTKQALGIQEELSSRIDAINKSSHEKIKQIFNPEGGLNHDQLSTQIKGLQKEIASTVIPAPRMGTVGGVLSPVRSVVINQDQINEAKAARQQLQNALSVAQRDFSAQTNAARPIADAAFQNILADTKNSGLKYVQMWKDLGSEAMRALQEGTRAGLAKAMGASNPFAALMQAKNDVKSTLESFKQGLEIIDGRFDLVKKAKEAAAAAFPGFAAMWADLAGWKQKKEQETRDPIRAASEFPEMIRRGSAEALKLQFNSASANGVDTPRRQLSEAEKTNAKMDQLIKQLGFQVVDF